MERSPKKRKTANYGLPSAEHLKKPGVAGRAMNKMIREDALVEKFHRAMVHLGIIMRYALALALYADPDAFRAWASDERVKKLVRPLKGLEDIFRAVCYATITDPKKASKYYKRVEHLWKNKEQPEAVALLLKRYGLEQPIPGVTVRKKRSPPHEEKGSPKSTDAQPIAAASAVTTLETANGNLAPLGRDPSKRPFVRVVEQFRRIPDNDHTIVEQHRDSELAPPSKQNSKADLTADDLAETARDGAEKPVAVVYLQPGDHCYKWGDSIRIIGTVEQSVEDGFWVNIEKLEPTLKRRES